MDALYHLTTRVLILTILSAISTLRSPVIDVTSKTLYKHELPESVALKTEKEKLMKILVAIDGSSYSEMSVQILEALQLPPKTEITVMTIVPEHTFLGGIRLDTLRRGEKAKELAHKAEEQKAMELLQETVDRLQTGGFKVETLVRWGKPSEEIVKASKSLRTDLLVAGAKGLSGSPLFPLGSTAQKVTKHAGCSVLLVRERIAHLQRVLVAADGSSYSESAIRFLIKLPLPNDTQVILVTALQSHIAAYVKMPTLDFETNREVVEELQAAEEIAAHNLLDETKEQFKVKGYKALSVVVRGDPAQEILAAVERFNPELIALGAKGLSGVESFLLGSVAQRIMRYAKCSVLIVRPSKET